MSARRGSFRFKAVRLARAPLRAPWRAAFTRAGSIAMRCAMAAAVAALTLACGLQAWRVGAESYRLHKQISALELRNADLAASSASLRTEVKALHDPEYLVPLIHEQLGLTKPHEVFIVVQTPAPSAIK
jgi:cell division protein FtsB